jgi:hypothetical protein
MILVFSPFPHHTTIHILTLHYQHHHQEVPAMASKAIPNHSTNLYISLTLLLQLNVANAKYLIHVSFLQSYMHLPFHFCIFMLLFYFYPILFSILITLRTISFSCPRILNLNFQDQIRQLLL